MKKKIFLFVLIGLLTLLATGILSACGAKDIEVPKPEVIGKENTDCEHEYEEVEYVEATCQVRAHTQYICTLCGDVYVVYSGELAEHTLAKRHKDGDCQSYGYTEHYCTVCQNVIATENDDKLGNHSYKNDGRHVDGNCITLGYTIKRKCSVCGNEDIQYDNVYGSHQYGAATHTEATCVTPDYDTSICKLCGDIKTEYGSDIRSHVFTETVVRGEDCQHTGTIVRSCINCDHVETEPTAVYGSHRFTDAGDGAKHICSVCGTNESHKKTVRDMSDERHLTSCSVCGYVYENESGAHVYGEAQTLPATCTTDGSVSKKCTVCDHTVSYILPAHHAFSQEDLILPTCTDDGYSTYTCENCSQKITVNYTAQAENASLGIVPMIEVTDSVSGEYPFGSYPQTRITAIGDPDLYLALTKKLPSLPTAEKKGVWTVYSYAKSAPYAWYVDITQENNTYRAVYFTAYRPALLTADPVANKSYVDDNGYGIGEVYFFRFDPIVWKPFSTTAGTTILISKKILDAQALGNSSSIWENSDIRAFLLTSFCDTAFTAEEKELICSAPDKVFLLSATKLRSYPDLTKVPTDYASCQGVNSLWLQGHSEPYSSWWLSPAENGWCSDKETVSYISGNQVEFCDCNIFAAVFKNDGKTDEIDSHATEAQLETPIVSSFDKLGKSFASFMESGSFSVLKSFLDEAIALFDKSNRSVSQKIAISANKACILGITQECYTSISDDSHAREERLTAVAKLFGFTDAETFLSYAQIIAATFKSNDVGASTYTNRDRLKYDGAVYTKSGSFILPFVFENSSAPTILSLVIVDNEGKMYICLSDLFAAFSATEDASGLIKIYGRCMLFENRQTTSTKYDVCMLESRTYRALGHDFICAEKTAENFRSAATCISFATYYKYCSRSRCGVLSDKYVEYEGDGLALHSYEYTYTADTHFRSCVTCGEILLQESHTFSYVDTGNGLQHVKKCATCGYFFNEIHQYVASDPCTQCNAPSIAYSQYWDVSEKGDLSIVAYLNGSELSFRGKGYMKNYSSTVHPPYYDYCADIRTVTLPATLYSIGEYAFSDFTALTHIAIPSGIRAIGKYAFNNTSSLTELNFNAISCGDFAPDNNVFRSAGNRMTITVGSGVTRIPAYLFYPSKNNLPSISAIYGGNQLTTIGAYAFYQLSTTAYVGPTSSFYTPALKKIGEYAFYNNALLSQFILSDDLAYVGEYAFYNCSATDFIGDPTLTFIGKYAFYNCSGLRTVELSGMKEVPEYAFYSAGLRNVTLPQTMTSIEQYSFYNCSELISVSMPSSLVTIKKYAFYNGGAVGNFVADNIKTIEEYAFFGCYGITDISAPELTSLGAFAFASCNDLFGFSANKLTTLNDSVFSDCPSLREVTYSEDLTTIGNNCFLRCPKLHHVLLPEKLTTIGTNAFAGCLTLVEIDNRSSFSLRMGATSYGSVALNAKRISNGKTDASVIDERDDLIVLTVGSTEYVIDVLYDRVADDISIADYVVASYAFYGRDDIESVTITSGQIERYAFAECENLSSVTLGSDVTSVAKTAFSGDNIATLTVMGGALQEEIDERADYFTDATVLSLFYGETEIISPVTPIDSTVLKEGDLTETISYSYKKDKTLYLTGTGEIPEIADSDLFGTKKVVIGDGITSVGSYAFSHFASLERVDISESITAIKDHAFYQCYSLRSIDLPAAITTIGNYAFADCYGVESIYYNCTKVSNVGRDNYIFYNCGRNGPGIYLYINCENLPDYIFNPVFSSSSSSPKITTIAIGSGLSTVGNFAFRNLTLITDLSFADTTATIGNGALSGMTRLQNLTVYSLSAVLGTLFAPDTLTADNRYVPSSLQKVTVLSCTDIPDLAFMGIASLQKITLPAGINSIGERAFSSCSSLTSFGLSGSNSSATPFTDLTNVGEKAFSDCVSLTSLTISSLSTVAIGDYAFSGCSSLSAFRAENVKVLESDSFVLGKNVFYLCTGLTSLTLTGDHLYCDSSSEVIPATNESPAKTVYSFGIYFVDNTEGCFVAYAGGKTSYTIADTVEGKPVTTIGEEAFADPDGKSSLVSVTINTLCEEIQASAFYGNASLKRIVFTPPVSPATPNLKFVKAHAFADCPSLSSITLPSSVTSIEEEAFKNCTSLTSFYLPKSVATIEKSAFESCRKLQTITFENGNTSLNSLSDKTFYSCVLLSEITLPKNITTIGTSAFEQCTSLASVTLPSALTTIRNNAFSHCKKLNSFDLVGQGINITSIGSNVFNGCTDLKTITLPTSVSSLGAGVFTGCSGLENLTLPFIGTTEIDERNDISYFYPFGYYFGTASYSDSVRIEQYYTKTTTKATTYERALYYIPRSLKNITSLGGSVLPYGAFMNCSTLQSINIHEVDVSTLPTKTFSGCSALRSIVFPSSLEAIEGEAFYACTSLTFVDENDAPLLSSTVTTIDKSAFYMTGLFYGGSNWQDGVLYVKVKQDDSVVYYAVNCTPSSETSCTLKEGTVRILSYAFENSSFTELYIPSSIRYIGEGILKGNRKLTLLSTPFIGSHMNSTSDAYLAYFFGVALNDPSKLADSKKLANGTVSDPGTGAFVPSTLDTLILTGMGDLSANVCNGCNYLKTLTLTGYETIPTFAFASCTSLETINFPTGLRHIDSYAFEDCSHVTEIILPRTMEQIRVGAFAGCDALKIYSAPFVGSDRNTDETGFLGYLFSSSVNTSDPSPENNGNLVPEELSTVIVSGDYPIIPEGAFYGCSNITTVVLTNQVTTIKKHAFAGCGSLQTIYFIGSGNSTLNTIEDDNVNFNTALATSNYQISYEQDAPEVSVRPLSSYLENPLYGGETNSYSAFQAYLAQQPYFTNELSHSSDFFLVPVLATSSDENVASFRYTFRWTETQNGTSVSREQSIGNQTKDEILLLATGETTVTITYRINGIIPITLSYTLTVTDVD